VFTLVFCSRCFSRLTCYLANVINKHFLVYGVLIQLQNQQFIAVYLALIKVFTFPKLCRELLTYLQFYPYVISDFVSFLSSNITIYLCKH